MTMGPGTSSHNGQMSPPRSRSRAILAAIAMPVPFALVHIAAVVGVVYYGWSWSGFALAIALYYARIFLVSGWYHRYFSHRTFKTSRWLQFVMAVLAETTVQKGIIWWASLHRKHHKYSDVPGDVHSLKLDGFWWSHVGWIVSRQHDEIDRARVPDLLAYPELVWVDRLQVLPVIGLAVACFLLGGMHALLWGFFVSTVLLWHGTFTINSLAHLIGTRRFATSDDSRNNFVLALLTMGEGWHNNHHHYQSSVDQGFVWWEIDLTYYVLRAMAAVGLVWDLRRPPRNVLAQASDASAPVPERGGVRLPLAPTVTPAALVEPIASPADAE